MQISETDFEQTLKLKCASRILSRKDTLDQKGKSFTV